MAAADTLTGALAPTGEAFARFGIAGHAEAQKQHQWHGTYDGRAWDAWLGARRKYTYFGDMRTRRTIGYRLRVSASTPVMMRAFVLRRGFATNVVARRLHRQRGLELMPGAPAGLEQFRVVACDTAWVAHLLARPEAARLMASLVEYRRGYGECADISFVPGQLHYSSPQLQPEQIDADHVASIVTRLAALAREAEQVAPPTNPAAATDTRDTGSLVMLVAGLFVGALALLLAAALAIVAIAVAAARWLR